MSDQGTRDRYSYFVNSMLFLFALFININNTIADIALFGLSMAGVYILKKKHINPFKVYRLRFLLIITAGYYFTNLVIFFINGTNFAKYLQTDLYFLLAVFVAAAIHYAKVNISLFFLGIKLALLFLGLSHFLSFDVTNIYISQFSPILVLMMFLSILNYDNDTVISRILGVAAFIIGTILIVDFAIRLSWVVFIILSIVVISLIFKKRKINNISIFISLMVVTLFIFFINSNIGLNDYGYKRGYVIEERVTRAFNELTNWSIGTKLNTSIGLRLEMYSSGLEAFKEKPFFGHGYLNGTKEASKYADPRVKSIIYNYVQMHSEYVTTMVEKGFFGLLSLVILVVSPFLFCIRKYDKDDIYIRVGIVTSISFILFGLLNASFGSTTFKALYVLLICLFLPNIFKEKV